MIKVFIPSHNRAETICSHRLFDPKHFEVKIFVHDDEQLQNYRKNPEVRDLVMIGSAERGCGEQKKWINLNMTTEGEWYICCDDNIERLSGVGDELSQLRVLDETTCPEYMKKFDETIDSERMKLIFEEMTYIGDKHSLFFQGFAIVDNPFFRSKKYRTVGFVVGKMNIIKKTHLTYDSAFKVKDDYEFTAQHLLAYGGVLINNFMFPEGKHYQAGGLGSLKKREPLSIADAAALLQKYPGLFRYKDRPGRAPKSEVQMTFHSQKQIEKWRMSFS